MDIWLLLLLLLGVGVVVDIVRAVGVGAVLLGKLLVSNWRNGVRLMNDMTPRSKKKAGGRQAYI